MGNVQGGTPTPEQYEYFMQHSGDSRVAGIIASATSFLFFCTVFVFLRLIGRRLIHHRLYVHVSDSLLMVSWAFTIAATVGLGFYTKYGGGRHIIFVTSRKGMQIAAIIVQVSYAMSMGFLKLSILALYGSIFPSRRFHQSLWALGVFTVLWSLTSALGSICQCVPIESFWDDSVEGHCFEIGFLQLTSTVCNIITDFIILFLPVGQICKLYMSKGKKRWIHFSLAMGASACLVRTLRIVFAPQVGSLDVSWADIPIAWASQAELCVGFLVVSIPTYQPIYRRIVYGSADALGVRTGKAYRLQAESYKSKSHIAHTVQASSQPALPLMPLDISVVNDNQPVRHKPRDGAWVRMPDNETGGFEFESERVYGRRGI